MSWSETQMILNRLKAGTRALPLLIIEDALNTLGGKTLTITNGTYTHTVGFPQGESILPVTLECLGDWSVSYVGNDNTVTKTVTVDKVGGVTFTFVTPVSWSSGTDAAIVQMVEYADHGAVDLSDYWNVGDERTVHLDAMAATGVGESHVAQDVTFVLMNVGGKTLVTPTESGRTECSFIVGMKDCLKETGYVNGTRTNVGGWASCARHIWCNNVFKNALPSTLLPIFKQFQNKTSAGNNVSTINTTDDWFTLAAQIEVMGSITNTFAGEGTQFTYYETTANRVKSVNGSANDWWGRSPCVSSAYHFYMVGSDGGDTASYADLSHGIAPFGVI